MPKIIYYVAVSLDGYIAGEHNEISKFVASGNGVENIWLISRSIIP